MKLTLFINSVIEKAKKNPKVVVFPESEDPRITKAAQIAIKKKIAFPIVLSKKSIKGVKTLNHLKTEKLETYAKKLYEIRKEKGLSFEGAMKLLKDPNYFGTMMVYSGDADGMVSGSLSPTADVLKPAFQIIGKKAGFQKVFGVFFAAIDHKILLLADPVVNIEPTSEELAEIAIGTADLAKLNGIIPKVALLSFSTKGSAQHPLAKKVSDAAAIAKSKRPDIILDGEMQLDAAIVPEVCKIKCPKCNLKGNANVLIFPDLQTGNISYKIMQRIAKAKMIGPVLVGLKKPINDLSRGCSVDDIVNLAALTSIQAKK